MARSPAIRPLLLLLLAALACVAPPSAAAADTFLRSVWGGAGAVRGVSLHGMTAFATNGSAVVQLDLTTGLQARAFAFPGDQHAFVDVAVCGDGRTLLVTDMQAHTADAVLLYRVDIDSGKAMEVVLPTSAGAGLVGTYSVACTRRGLALVSSFYPGAQWSALFGYNIAADRAWQISAPGLSPRSDVLAASADGSLIVTTTSNMVASTMYVFNETLGLVGQGSVDAFTYTQALSATGRFLCVPTYNAALVYELLRPSRGAVSIRLAGSIAASAGGFTGCAFSPLDAATLATTQASAGGAAPLQVVFRDVSALVGSGGGNGSQVLATRNVAAAFSWPGNAAYGPGRVVFAPAGDAFAVPTLDGAAIGVQQCTYL